MLSSQMPKGSVSMAQAYNTAINGTDGTAGTGTLEHDRAKVAVLRRQSLKANANTANTHASIDRLQRQFPRLPDPSIVMYVYPHEVGSGSNETPVPGYSTLFPLYQHVIYALPGEIDRFKK